MTLNEQPFFMTNKEWYKFDMDKFKYVLTDKASQKAIDSYNEYYKLMDSQTKGKPTI